jgi:hypothetical protein
MSGAARCFICGRLESEFKTKGIWVAGKWHCPRCVKRLRSRNPNDWAYRSECYTCQFYRLNMYGGLNLPGEPDIPRYLCLKFEGKQPCIFDEPEPVKPLVASPTAIGTGPTLTPLGLASVGPEPRLASTPESLPPRVEPISLIPAASALPNRPKLESPGPKHRYPPRRERREK